MPDQKYTDDPHASSLVGGEKSPIEQGGLDKYFTPTDILNFIFAALSGTANRITFTSGNINIASNYVGQSSISTVGTVTTGTWSARFAPRTVDFVSPSTVSIDALTTDEAILFLNQNVAIDLVSIITSPPAQGQLLWVRWLDDSTPRTISFDPTFFRFENVQEPTTSIADQTGYALFVWNDEDSVFDCIVNTDAIGGSTAITADVIPVGNGTAIQDSSLFWKESTTRLGINIASPLGSLHIKKDHTPSYGQKVIQSETTTGSLTIIYESYYDSAGTRMMVMGLGHYRSGSDMNYYFANEYSGGSGAGVVFRNASDDTFEVTSAGTVLFKNQYSVSSTPSIAAGAGAGTGPTISIAGTNESGVITLTTGSTPTTGGKICDVTMSGSFAFPTKCIAVIDAVDDAAAGLGSVKITGTSTVFTLTAPTLVTLLASTTYTWNYINKGY